MNKEWKVRFYKMKTGECPVADFMNKLDKEDKDWFSLCIEYLENVGIELRRPQGDYLRDGIYELRVKLSGNNTRTLYFFCYETNIILTHTFTKRTEAVPNSEIEKALKYKQDFLQRYNKTNIDEE